MTTVANLMSILNKYEGDMEIVFVEHPHRGSTTQLDVDEHDVVQVEDDMNYDSEVDDEYPTVDILAIQLSDILSSDFTLAEGQEWPGRSR